MDERTPFERVGGDEAVRRLVDRFYDHMESLELAATIRAMHPDDLTDSRQKLYEFLCGWLGGPQLYRERHGHPRLRMRHAPFAVDGDAAEAWMQCMWRALHEVVEDAELRQWLAERLAQVAVHMVNRAD
jgi:hemoglobin